jgi:cobalt-zinc-cadmium efflux system outer membrane protein
MKGNKLLILASLVMIVILMSANSQAESFWDAPFDSSKAAIVSVDSTTSLNDVLQLVAAANPALKAFEFRIKAAQSNLKQVGLRPNPELSADFEEVGWNAPGFKESEFTILLSQEFDPFGQRGARKKVALSEIDVTRLQIKQSSFDLYLEVKQRFYSLAHAQQQVILSQTALELANNIVKNITYRLDRGAVLKSELLLAELEQQKAQLSLDQAMQNVLALETRLVSMWSGTQTGATLSTNMEPDFNQLQQTVATLSDNIESSRDMIRLRNDADMLHAKKMLAAKEAKPTITVNGGFKRLQFDDSKSLLFGISMPIPLFNRNQGEQEKVEAEIRSLEYELEHSRNEALAHIKSQALWMTQLIEKHAILNSLLLPTADNAYRTLQEAYKAGRVPYTQLLEAERSLIDISFEHNDMLLAIQEQIITLEQATGVVLRVDEEN